MRQLFVFPAILLLVSLVSPRTHADVNVVYSKRWVQETPVHVVTANLNSPNVTVSPAIARHGIGTSEGFGSMLSRLQPAAAITGVYFCVRSLQPVGDIVIDGLPVVTGSVGTAVCFTQGKGVEFKKAERGRAIDLAGYSSVLRTGPRLVTNGQATVSPWTEGFRDPSLFRKAQRSALGVTKHNKLLLVTVNRPVYLSKLAKIMKDLGAVDAVNLDGGSSTALYCNGIVPSHPSRTLTNLLVVYDSPAKFARVKDSLAPSAVVASKRTRS